MDALSTPKRLWRGVKTVAQLLVIAGALILIGLATVAKHIDGIDDDEMDGGYRVHPDIDRVD